MAELIAHTVDSGEQHVVGLNVFVPTTVELIQLIPVTTHPLPKGIEHKVGVGIPLFYLVNQLVHLAPKHLIRLLQHGNTSFIRLYQRLLCLDLRIRFNRQPRRR
jgi:hypothetical protein